MNKVAKQFIEDSASPVDSNSSVLIPSRLFDHFNQRSRIHGSRRRYLHFLVFSILPDISCYSELLASSRSQKWKTCYQNSGQSLIKKNFKPSPIDWEAMRQVASAFGVSICFLFVFLMEIDSGQKKLTRMSTKSFRKLRDWNSAPGRVQKLKKFRKFSKIWRVIDFERWKLIRKIQHY